MAREVARNGGRGRYRAVVAERATRRRACRPKARRLAIDRPLAREFERRLRLRHSPQQIAYRLRLEHPDEPLWWVSHETIYQALSLKGRGGLRAELTDALRTGRARRRRKGPNPGRGAHGKLKDIVSISERPAEVEDRAVPGHWEGELILRRGGKSQLARIVARTTRSTLLAPLPTDRKAHTRDAIATDIDVAFCDPHPPWQRSTNENTNGLLRRYLPRSLDLSDVTADRLDTIAAELNGRPRETLRSMTPSEKFNEHRAMTG